MKLQGTLQKEEEFRFIDVEWYKETNITYNVDIEIFAYDRNGLLADIIKEIGLTNSKLKAVTSKVNKEEIAVTEITIEIDNLNELNKVINTLKNINSVYDVTRRKQNWR